MIDWTQLRLLYRSDFTPAAAIRLILPAFRPWPVRDQPIALDTIAAFCGELERSRVHGFARRGAQFVRALLFPSFPLIFSPGLWAEL